MDVNAWKNGDCDSTKRFLGPHCHVKPPCLGTCSRVLTINYDVTGGRCEHDGSVGNTDL